MATEEVDALASLDHRAMRVGQSVCLRSVSTSISHSSVLQKLQRRRCKNSSSNWKRILIKIERRTVPDRGLYTITRNTKPKHCSRDSSGHIPKVLRPRIEGHLDNSLRTK